MSISGYFAKKLFPRSFFHSFHVLKLDFIYQNSKHFKIEDKVIWLWALIDKKKNWATQLNLEIEYMLNVMDFYLLLGILVNI